MQEQEVCTVGSIVLLSTFIGQDTLFNETEFYYVDAQPQFVIFAGFLVSTIDSFV